MAFPMVWRRRKRLTLLVIVLLAVVLLSVSDMRPIMPPTDAAIVLSPVPGRSEATSSRLETPLPNQPIVQEVPSAIIPDDPLLHILLVGVDSGDTGFDHGRTDSMILVTLDPISEKVKLTSFMRDLYVEIPGYGFSKINAAYAWGGMQLLKETLKHNFGLLPDRHVVIDFTGFERAIDIVGGVDIEIQDDEVSYVNTSGAGLQHLTGSQALHYVRIRCVGNSDYERTARQRRLLAALLNEVRDLPMSDYYRLYREIEPYIRINFSVLETLRIGYITYMLRDAEVETLRIPVDGTYESTYRQEMAVLIPDLNANLALLNRFLYSDHEGRNTQQPKIATEPSH